MGRWAQVCATVVMGCGCALACGSEGDEFTPGKKQDSGSGGSGGSVGGGAGSSGTAGAAGTPDIDSGGSAGADAAPDVVCDDLDGDGSTTCDGDCDDNDATSYPGAAEICGDAADNDCANGADDTCGGLGTFVSELTGDDANPGTQDQPVKTVGKGIANAQTIQATTLAPIDVYVAEGTYKEKVTLVEKVNLVGGFSCTTQPCSWARDPLLYVSTIENQDFEGVLADASITRQTRFDGFLVHGMSGTPGSVGVIGVTLAGGTPTIVNNTIIAGDSSASGGSAGRSTGLLLYGPSNDVNGARVEANDIRGGAATDTSSGIFFDGGGKPGFNYAEVVSNQISGGKGKNAQGITAWSSGVGTLIQNNDIQAGEAEGAAWGIAIGSKALIDSNRINADGTKQASCEQSGFCGGIRSDSASITITNNVVFGTESWQSAGVLLGEFEIPAGAVTLNSNYLDGGGSPNGQLSAALALQHGQCCGQVAIVGRVANNVLAGGESASRYGVYELKVSAKAAHPELLMNNDFFVPNLTASDGYYQHTDPFGVITKASTLAELAALSTKLPLVSGNIDGDPMLDTTFHLPTGSPAINAGTAVDLPATDFEGEARPKGSAGDIGPDEAE